MKIAMLGHKRIPSREGGVEIVVEELSVRLVQQGHQVTCYNRSGHHVSGREFDAEALSEYKGIALINVPTVETKGLAAVTASFFAALRAAFSQAEVVHFHAEGPCSMLWLPKLMGKRCIATIHGLDHQRAKWGKFASAYIKGGEKCAVKYADEIIVLSQEVQKYFQREYGRKTCFIPNGVNPAHCRSAQRITEIYGLKKNDYILFLGRLVPEKGLRYLIEAFKKVRTEKKLVIAGGNSDTESFQQELKSMAAEDARIIFTGFVQGRLLEELYSNAWVYTLPSDLEGMPLSLLEAMSYGNCCLVSDIQECAQVVGTNGIIFKKGDIKALQEKLQLCCQETELVLKYKAEAADYILKKYNWDTVVEQTLRLYQGVGND